MSFQHALILFVGAVLGMCGMALVAMAKRPVEPPRPRFFILDADNNAKEITFDEFRALKPMSSLIEQWRTERALRGEE